MILGCAAALFLLSACSGGSDGASDSGPTRDTGPIDAARHDANGADVVAPDMGMDGGMTDAAPVDADMQPEACRAGAMIDLNATGTKTGSITHYLGNNASATLTSTVQAPSCSPRVWHEIVFQYVPATTTKLAVSTDYTDTSTDTVVWALDGCARGGVHELACNEASYAPPRETASTFFVDTVPAGTPIYIVVAGYGHDTGNFDLSVRELSAVPVGHACDLTDIANYCATGSHCLAGGSQDACVADGTISAVCRESGSPCDANLACNGMPGDFGARCVPLVALGDACDPMGHDDRCAPPGECLGLQGHPPACTLAPYVESAIASPTFVDACASGTRVSLISGTGASPRDDGHSSGALSIPFAFTFFGQSETMIWPDTNGYAVFGSMPPLDLVGGPAAVPELSDGALVAPMFEDLILPASPGADICSTTIGSAPNRKFVIEWLHAYAYGANAPTQMDLTFEVIITESENTVDFIYDELQSGSGDVTFGNGSEAAIEVQSSNGSNYAAHMGSVSIGQGIRFTPR
jgi:hypothetical protein